MARTPRGDPEGRPTQLLTMGEAAQRLALHVKTVRIYADTGRLTKVRLGPQTVRVTAESVEALITEGIAVAGGLNTRESVAV
jgi:excisionase family DNA binding protein